MPRARTASAQKPAPHCLPAQNPRALNVDPPLSPAGYIVTRSHSEAVKASDSRTIEYNATENRARRRRGAPGSAHAPRGVKYTRPTQSGFSISIKCVIHLRNALSDSCAAAMLWHLSLCPMYYVTVRGCIL